MRRTSPALAILAAVSFSASAMAAPAPCKSWSEPERIGTLDGKIIAEASGIAISQKFPSRLYHNNDSGDGPNFYITDMAGGGTETVSVAGFKPTDVEDIALGKCGRKTCLYLGDIGDNTSYRKDVTFVILAEKDHYASPETPLRIITARYPDSPHDSEGFAIHPNGDLYLITKPMDWNQRKAGVAQVFKLSAKQLASQSTEPQTFTEVADIDLPWLLFVSGVPGQIVTALDIAPDGKRFLMLTYQTAVEAEFDLSRPLKPSHMWVPDKDYRVVTTAKQPQQEAIAYTSDGGFIYDTESVGQPDVPLYRQACSTR